MWKKNLDPFITVLKCSTSSVLPIMFCHPDLVTTAHITVYLPTRGKEAEFVNALASLDNTIEDVKELYPESEIIIHGDGNVNP